MPGVLALSLFGLGAVALRYSTPLPCQEITIPVSVSAHNKDLPITLNASSFQNPGALNDLVAGLGSSLVSGTYDIVARYCKPTRSVASRSNTLQVLVHGITLTKDYWSGLAPPGTKAGQDQYSWILYAAKQGYPTLSIDRLCNGQSSHPNGLAICQLPLEVETIHAIFKSARNGKLPGISKSFKKIIYAGHSYGSLVGNGLSVQHPDDADALILSGFSQLLTQGEAGIIVRPMFLPAAVVLPTRFGNLLTDPSYVAGTSQSGFEPECFYGDFKKAFASYAWANRGTVTVGEVATAQLGQVNAPTYNGPVYVLDGKEDNIFCETDEASALAAVPANCSNGFASGVKASYPGASSFRYHITPQTGHCLNLHTTAQQSYKAAHDWLAQVGF